MLGKATAKLSFSITFKKKEKVLTEAPWVDKTAPRNYQLLNENFSAMGGLFPFGTIGRKALKAPKTIQAVPLFLMAHQNWMVRPYC